MRRVYGKLGRFSRKEMFLERQAEGVDAAMTDLVLGMVMLAAFAPVAIAATVAATAAILVRVFIVVLLMCEKNPRGVSCEKYAPVSGLVHNASTNDETVIWA